MRPRRQPVEEICHVNSVAVQRYKGIDPQSSASDRYGCPVECEMVTLFYSGGAKIDMSASAFTMICEKWLAELEVKS